MGKTGDIALQAIANAANQAWALIEWRRECEQARREIEAAGNKLRQDRGETRCS